MKISKGTIVRTIMLTIVIINMLSQKVSGRVLFFMDESSIVNVVDLAISAAVIVTGYWKNNSYSEKARKADDYLKQLKESEGE